MTDAAISSNNDDDGDDGDDGDDEPHPPFVDVCPASAFLDVDSSRAIFTIYSYVHNQLDGLFFVIAIFCSKVREYFLLKL